MNAADSIRRLHRHRMRVDRLLLDAVRVLDEVQLHQNLPIGQGSVWKTLMHMAAAEYVWLEALLGNESPTMPGDVANKLPGNQEGAGAIESLDELAVRWNHLDARWQVYLNALDDNSLDELVWKTSTSSGAGKRQATARLDVLLHVCTHAQYTAAQLVNMLRQLGQTKLPDVMLISMARAENDPAGHITDRG